MRQELGVLGNLLGSLAGSRASRSGGRGRGTVATARVDNSHVDLQVLIVLVVAISANVETIDVSGAGTSQVFKLRSQLGILDDLANDILEGLMAQVHHGRGIAVEEMVLSHSSRAILGTALAVAWNPFLDTKLADGWQAKVEAKGNHELRVVQGETCIRRQGSKEGRGTWAALGVELSSLLIGGQHAGLEGLYIEDSLALY